MPQIAPIIAGAFGALKATLAAGGIGAFLIRTAISVGLSLLAQRLMGRQREPGQRIDGTSAGEDIPQSFILGRYLTGGHLEYHGSHGDAGGTPNAFYTLVISLSDVPGVALRRVRVNDRWVDLGGTPHADFGLPMLDYRKGSEDFAWVRFYDGSHTTADAMLVSRYGSDPDQPWTAQHIGTGVAYAIVTLRFDREQFQGVPRFGFELGGIPVYDPRLDSTRGGDGPQRADDPATWAPSTNLAVLAYNLLLGIPLPGGSVYGGGVPVDDIPLANAVAGMNVCDELIGEGDDERAQFHGGLEIRVDQEPAEAIEELLRAGLGQISELGGVFRTRWGAPDLPVLAIADEDLSISDPQSFEPFPGLQSTHNAVRITHPSPDHLWEPVQTPADFSAAWEAQDGGRRLPVQMVVPACFDHGQAQQLAHAYAEDNRRWRQHQIVLPGDAQVLEALDTITWTSARNGYSSKLFEVVQASYRPGSLFVALTLRERDPDDYDWSADFELPAPPAPAPAVVDLRVVATADWGIEAIALRDNASEPRRPGLRLHWTPAVVEDAVSVQWQLELSATNEVVASGTARAADGAVVFAGALPETTYRARIRPQLSRPTGWTDWKSATTLALYLTEADLDALLRARIDAAFERHDEALGRARGNIAEIRGQLTAIRDYLDTLAEDDIEEDAQTFRRRAELRSAVEEAEAAIVQEQIVRATADAALAADITTITASVGANTAQIEHLSATRVDAAGAVAAVEATISVQYGSLSAMATATAFAQATLEGVETGFVWSLGAGDVLSLVQISDGTTAPVTTARLNANYIILNGDVEVDGTFAIASGTTGARVVINTQGVFVYDASNVLRVKIGSLA